MLSAAAGLLAVLARMADLRHRRGVRHRLVVILGLAVCAVLAADPALDELGHLADVTPGIQGLRRS
jgi:hypothetical protein